MFVRAHDMRALLALVLVACVAVAPVGGAGWAAPAPPAPEQEPGFTSRGMLLASEPAQRIGPAKLGHSAAPAAALRAAHGHDPVDRPAGPDGPATWRAPSWIALMLLGTRMQMGGG